MSQYPNSRPGGYAGRPNRPAKSKYLLDCLKGMTLEEQFIHVTRLIIQSPTRGRLRALGHLLYDWEMGPVYASLRKALEAGNYNAAPAPLTEGCSLQVEDLSPVMDLVVFTQPVPLDFGPGKLVRRRGTLR